MTSICHAWIGNQWREVTVEQALARPKLLVRCAECKGAVRLHRAGHSGSTRAHVEHRVGFEGCSLGNYFDGNHRPNPNPVADPAPESNESLLGLVAPEEDEDLYPEGAERFREHRGIERSGLLPARVKASRMRQKGALKCEACGFDFKATYGELGEGFIEAHHKVPVAAGPRHSRAADIALLCSNCHRIIHRAGAAMSIEALRAILAKHRET